MQVITIDGLHIAIRLGATYIPELANADPDRFAVAVCTTSGEMVWAGDTNRPFTIHAVCKPSL